MDLYKEILINILKDNDIEITFKGIEFDYNKLLENKSYVALNEIKKILANDTIDNANCLKKHKKLLIHIKHYLFPKHTISAEKNRTFTFRKASLA